MFFSLLKLDLEKFNAYQWQKLVAKNEYHIHRSLVTLFPYPGKTEFLFSEDFENYTDSMGNLSKSPIYYIVSERAPILYSDFLKLEVKSYSPNFNVGQRLNFFLRANPTMRKSRVNKNIDIFESLKKSFVGTTEELRFKAKNLLYEWLEKRANRFGFKIDIDQLNIYNYQHHNFFKKSENRTIHISSVDYGGTLTVIDPDLFLNAVLHGIGRAQAFGCGLLLVRNI